MRGARAVVLRDGWLVALCGVASLVIAFAIVHPRKWAWYDEAVTLLILNERTWGRLLTAVRQVETAPPLYHLLAHAWILVFGGSPLSLRVFTLVGLCAALLTLWGTLVRVYPWRATAVGVLSVFCASNLVFMQIAEVRFYGLLTTLVAVAALLCHRLMLAQRPSAGLLAANTGVHAALVLTHIYGGLYGAGLLGALVAWDVARGAGSPRAAWRRWGAPVLGWLALLPWLGVYRSQRATVARSWIEVPGLSSLTRAYDFELATDVVPFVLAATLLTALLGGCFGVASRARDNGGADATPAGRDAARSDRRTAMLFVGAGLLTVPVSAFIVSRIAVPIFYGRYFIAAAFGAAILIAHTVTLALDGRSPAAGAPGASTHVPAVPSRVARALTAASWTGTLAVLLVWPVLRARQYPRSQRPGAVLERIRVDGAPVTALPIVVESAFDYLPILTYTSLPRSAFTYVLDSATALDPRSHFREMLSYGVMVRYRELGSTGGRVERYDRFLCAHDRFVVVHTNESQWFARRVLQDPAFRAEEVGRSDANPIYQPGTTLYLVRRVPGASPRACERGATSAAAPRS